MEGRGGTSSRLSRDVRTSPDYLRRVRASTGRRGAMRLRLRDGCWAVFARLTASFLRWRGWRSIRESDVEEEPARARARYEEKRYIVGVL